MTRRRKPQARAGRRAGLGGVTVETLVLAGVVGAALGLGFSEGGALRDLLDAFRDAYRRFAYAISLP